jgi:hypothetical protein
VPMVTHSGVAPRSVKPYATASRGAHGFEAGGGGGAQASPAAGSPQPT